VDSIVPGLCAFLLGVCYEFDREPGEITRSGIHPLFLALYHMLTYTPAYRATIAPILNRLGVDSLIGRLARLREDERFKAVGPDSIVLPYPTPSYPGLKPESEGESEIWFDWAFVDFWKSNYCQCSSLFILFFD
jgi:intracellular protein transport protein USO1